MPCFLEQLLAAGNSAEEALVVAQEFLCFEVHGAFQMRVSGPSPLSGESLPEGV